jgi:hypothetical protein
VDTHDGGGRPGAHAVTAPDWAAILAGAAGVAWINWYFFLAADRRGGPRGA